MSREEFVGGIPVRPTGSERVMTLAGSPESWICVWQENGQIVMQTFEPEELERVEA